MLDNSLIAAIVTSVATAGSTAAVAIVALTINNKRFDSLERKMDKLDDKVDKLNDKIDAKLTQVHAALDMLNGTTNELDKRLSIIEIECSTGHKSATLSSAI